MWDDKKYYVEVAGRIHYMTFPKYMGEGDIFTYNGRGYRVESVCLGDTDELNVQEIYDFNVVAPLIVEDLGTRY